MTSQRRNLDRVAGTAAAVAAVAPLPWAALAERSGGTPRRILHRLARIVLRPHVHWFRWCGEDPAGHGSLYKCRCGVVRPGF